MFASLSREVWRREPAEVRIRMLARLLGAFGGDSKPARLSQVEALEAAMSRDDQPMAQTLGGCIVSQGRTTLRLYREPPPVPVPDVPLAAGQELLWDWRFRIRYEPETGEDGVELANAPVVVRPSGSPRMQPCGTNFASITVLRRVLRPDFLHLVSRQTHRCAAAGGQARPAMAVSVPNSLGSSVR